MSEEGIKNNTLGVVAKTFNKLLVEHPETIPMYTSGMMLNLGEAHQAARQAGLDYADASVVGAVTGALNTLLENKLGANVMNKWLAGGGARNTAADVIRSVGGDVSKLSERGVSDAVKRNFFDSVNKFLETPVIGSAMEEGFEEIA